VEGEGVRAHLTFQVHAVRVRFRVRARGFKNARLKISILKCFRWEILSLSKITCSKTKKVDQKVSG
jgi:hypothetical protein